MHPMANWTQAIAVSDRRGLSLLEAASAMTTAAKWSSITLTRCCGHEARENDSKFHCSTSSPWGPILMDDVCSCRETTSDIDTRPVFSDGSCAETTSSNSSQTIWFNLAMGSDTIASEDLASSCPIVGSSDWRDSSDCRLDDE